MKRLESASTDEPNVPPPRRGSHFPLFWLLIPQIAAFAFCGNIPWSMEISVARWLAAAVFLFVVSAFACFCENFFSGRSGIRAAAGFCGIGIPVAAFFFFCAWWNLCTPPVVDWSKKSPRDVEVELRVEKSYSSSERNFSGIARVEKISGEAVESIVGTRVWYSVSRVLCRESEIVEAPVEGARLRVFGVLTGISDSDFSSGFVGFLRRERVSAFVSRIDEIAPIDCGGKSFAENCAAVKKFLKRKLEKISDPLGGGEFVRCSRILGAMLLGERSLLAPDQKENFLLTGTMHLFAVSGLHISILAAGILWVLRIFRVPHIPAWIAMLACLWFFVQIIGSPPSAMRAWLMSVFVFSGCVFGRGNMAFHGLAAAAFIALMIDPLVLNNTGFRLSYFVVAAILLYGVPAAELLTQLTDFNRWIPDFALSRPRKIAEGSVRAVIFVFCISVAAFIAGAPIVIAMFGYCSVLSLVANVVLIPIAGVSMWLGASALAAASLPVVGDILGAGIFILAAIPLTALDWITSVFSRLPGGLEMLFLREAFGAIESLMFLVLFFLGDQLSFFRERQALRFLFPLGVFLVNLVLSAY